MVNVSLSNTKSGKVCFNDQCATLTFYFCLFDGQRRCTQIVGGRKCHCDLMCTELR